MSLRISKVRKTDFRPPGAGGTSPVGRDCKPQPRAVACPDVWQAREAKRAAEAADHDRWVATLSPAACVGAAMDLCTRSVTGLPWAEKAWIEGRRAALRRRIAREGWTAEQAKGF